MPVSLAREKCAMAVAAADVGFRVFPVKANSKLPAVKDWPNEATTDRDRIESWWRSDPNFNIGVATGDGTMVLDVDTKNGRDGIGSLDYLDALGLPTSYRVRTPSGGLHVYLRTDTAHSNRANTIEGLSGLDLRGEHGYVLGAGSTIDGVAYAPDGGAPQDLADAPAWFLDILGQRSKHAARGDQPLTELDRPENIARGVDWLRHHAPEAIEGAGGDTTTYSVAAEMRAFGLSEATALDVMLEHWNEAKASPPWMPDELAVKVANAYRHGQGAPGYKTAAGEFGALDIDIGEPPVAGIPTTGADGIGRSKRREVFRAHSLAESRALVRAPRKPPLVRGFLGRGSLAVIYGKPNDGKTFAAMDLAMAIADGQPWAGAETLRGTAIYVAAEGGGEVHDRVEAIARHRNVPDAAPFYIAPRTINLRDSPTDVDEVVAFARQVAERCAVPAGIIVLDTLNRVLAGGDENGVQDMGKLIENADTIRHKTGAAVLLVHHAGKDMAKGARGHSSLLAAVDTELEVSADAKSGERVIRTTKQRNMPRANDVRFKLQPVVVGVDDRGESIVSCHVVYPGPDEFGPLPIAEAATSYLGTLRAALADGRASLPPRDWDELHCRQKDPAWRPGDKEPKGCSERQLRALRRELLDCGYVVRNSDESFSPIE